MTRHVRDSFDVDESDIEVAFERVFGHDMLVRMYGTDVHVGPWKDTSEKSRVTRTVRGGMRLEGAPKEILRILGGSRLRATTVQNVTRVVDTEATRIEVKNKVRMHFLGAELVRVQPHFELTQDRRPPHKTTFAADIKLDALFPPPINILVESFMSTFARSQLALARDACSRCTDGRPG